MAFYKLSLLGAVLALSSCAYVADSHHADTLFANALNDAARPVADRNRDEGRKPIQVLQFAGITPGMRVLDIVASGGYYTEVLSHRVGEKGEVLAHNDRFILEVLDGRFKKEMDARLANNRLANVKPWHKELGELGLNSEMDAATLVLNYHDMVSNFPPERRQAVLADIKQALKPGGIFLVIDMEANAGPHNAKLHRVKSEIVKNEVLSAGFSLAAQSTLLANPADDHTLVVFDPSIRGKADRFIYKFTK